MVCAFLHTGFVPAPTLMVRQLFLQHFAEYPPCISAAYPAFGWTSQLLGLQAVGLLTLVNTLIGSRTESYSPVVI